MNRAIAAILSLGILTAGGWAQMTIHEDARQGTVTIKDGGRDVLTYRYRDQLKPGFEPKNVRSCYIHPLFSLDGEILTDDSPADHLHHHGIFWTWPVVKTRGLETQTWMPAEPPLRQVFECWLERRAGSGAAVLAVENAWSLSGRETVAREKTTLRVFADRALGRDVEEPSAEGRAIDVLIEIEAIGGSLELRGTPEGGKGYGGLCFRGAPLFTGAAMTTDRGPLAEDVVHTPFQWADLSTPALGVAIFASPAHPDAPVRWLVRNSYAGVINPSWPGLASAVLVPGRPVRLAYRIYVHRGDARAGRVAEAYARYISEK